MKSAQPSKNSKHSSNNHSHNNTPNVFKKDKQSFFGGNQESFFKPPIQAKLSVNEPGDKYEVEADAMADQVVQRLGNNNNTTEDDTIQRREEADEIQQKPITEKETGSFNIQTKLAHDTSINFGGVLQTKGTETEDKLQRKEEETTEIEESVQMKESIEGGAPATDEDETIQTKPNTTTNEELQLKAVTEEPEKVQAKEQEEQIQTKAEATTQASSNFESKLNSSKGGGNPLPTDTQDSMGNAFGADFSDVRVHTDSNAVQMSQDINAQAFTHGKDIYFNEGKYDTGSTSGQHLLAHELTHTMQQGAVVRKKPQVSSTGGNTIQRLFGISDGIRNKIANKVNNYLPVYPLLSVIIGYDLIRGEKVARNRNNILRGIFSIVPFGAILYQRLQETGVITKAFTFINNQLNSLGLTLTALKNTFSQFWKATDFVRTNPISYNLNLFRQYFGKYARRLKSFAVNVKNKVVKFIKEAFLSRLAKLAKALGGYDLLADLLGYDPITGKVRKASTARILRGILKLPLLRMMGGDKLLAKLEEYKLVNRVAAWVDKQWALLKGAFANMKNIATKFMSLFTFQTLRAPMKFVNSLKNEVVGFVTKIGTFFKNIGKTALKLIKQALTWGLKQFVGKNTPGYDLVGTILGKDILTGQKIARSPKNIIKGFIGLLPGGKALYEQFEKTGAIENMKAWAMGAVQEFVQILGMLKTSFINTWKNASIHQLFQPFKFFQKILRLFQKPVVRLIAFVKNVVAKLFEVLLQIMSFPLKMAQQIIANVRAAFESIKQDPIGFLKKMLGAVKQGFSMFFANFGKHLMVGVSGWLFGQVAKAGLAPPTDMSLGSILKMVMQILGITVDKIWLMLENRLGKEKVEKIKRNIDKLKGVWTFVRDVIQNGVSAVWTYIQEKISNLWNMVVEEIQSWMLTKVIQKVTTKLLSMLDPTGIMAVVNGFQALFNAIQSFMEYYKQMLGILNTFVGGMAEIAKGIIIKAAKFLESGLAKALPVAIGFLANQVGLNNIGKKLGEIIGKVRGAVELALNWLMEQAMKGIDSIMGLFGKRKTRERNTTQESSSTQDKNDPVAGYEIVGLDASINVDGGHHLEIEKATNKTLRLAVFSERKTLNQLVKLKKKEIEDNKGQDPNNKKKEKALAKIIAEKKILGRKYVREYIRVVKRAYAKNNKSKKSDIIKAHTEVKNSLKRIASQLEIVGVDLEKWVTPESKIIKTMTNGMAKRVVAQPLTGVPSSRYAGSAASALPKGWDTIPSELRTRGQWVKAHLLSHKLHGPGDQVWNLFPGSKEMNLTNMENQVESEAKDRIGAGEILFYNVVLTYGNKGQYDFIPTEVYMQFGEYDHIAKKRKKTYKSITFKQSPPTGNAVETNNLNTSSASALNKEAQKAGFENMGRFFTYIVKERNKGGSFPKVIPIINKRMNKQPYYETNSKVLQKHIENLDILLDQGLIVT